jgi:hypothetical protein
MYRKIWLVKKRVEVSKQIPSIGGYFVRIQSVENEVC